MADKQRTASGQEIPFAQSPKYPLGVEIEFQTAPSLLRPRLSPEFIQSILEIQTGVCSSLTDVENDLMPTISFADELYKKSCRSLQGEFRQ